MLRAVLAATHRSLTVAAELAKQPKTAAVFTDEAARLQCLIQTVDEARKQWDLEGSD